jgi:hypothetical protein
MLMQYDAFISYSHSADSELAPSLEEGLEQFAKPIFKRSALRIFRDANDLSASPNLWGTIESGLAASDYFIFMASPRAAQSKWCQKEVEYWKTNKAIDHFLIVLTEGELVWDDERQDFDWDETTAIPPNLSGVFDDEPLFVDFREPPAALSLNDPDFQQKIVLLAATIHGRTIEDMIGEGVRQHKRTIRIRNTAIALLSVLFISALLLYIYAMQQKSEAQKNEKIATEKAAEAEQQANRALSKNYLLESRANLDVDPTLAMKLAVHAYQFAKQHGFELKDFKEQLITAFYRSTHFYNEQEQTFELDESFVDLPFPTNLNGCTFNSDDFVLECSSGENIQLRINHNDINPSTVVDSFTFSPDYRYIVLFYHTLFNRRIIKGQMIFRRNGEFIKEMGNSIEIGDDSTPSRPCIRTSAKGERVLVCDADQAIVFDNDEDQAIIFDSNKWGAIQRPIFRADISPDGRLVALGNKDGDIELFQLKGKNVSNTPWYWHLDGHRGEPITALSFTEDNKFLLSQSEHIKRKWKVDGLLPYVQMETLPDHLEKMDSTFGHEARIQVSAPTAPGIGPERILYLNPAGDTIAVFSENEDFTRSLGAVTRVVNGDYSLNPKGLYNANNEQLIALDLRTYHVLGSFEACGFSDDGRYLFAKDRIYLLDAEKIIERYQNTEYFGHIPPFSDEEREDYLIIEKE